MQREKNQVCTRTDGEQHGKGLEILVDVGPSVTYRGSKPPEEHRPTWTELPVATRVAGRTGERKSETCSSFQAIRDSQIP